MNQYQERALSRDKREKLPIVVREKPVVPSPCATISSLALCTFTVSSSDLFESPLHGKIKEKVLGSEVCPTRL
jgi:hypothetical protein